MKQVVSLGSSCVAKAMIARAGYDQPTYPFDDMFTNIDVPKQALSDNFAAFLDADSYIPVMRPLGWVQRLYRENYGLHQTFAHHDMSLPEKQAKMERRVDRFRRLIDPLFLVIDYADRMGSLHKIAGLRRAVHKRFPGSSLLFIMIGDGLDGAEAMRLPATTIERIKPASPMLPARFGDEADNDTVCNMIARQAQRRPLAA